MEDFYEGPSIDISYLYDHLEKPYWINNMDLKAILFILTRNKNRLKELRFRVRLMFDILKNEWNVSEDSSINYLAQFSKY